MKKSPVAMAVLAALAGVGFSAWRTLQAQRADADLWRDATDTI